MNFFGMVTTSASRDYTPLALRSFLEHTPVAQVGRFVLIDNDGDFLLPDDVSAELITIVRPDAPRGFAANANALLAEAVKLGADLFLLHNDVVFTPHWLDPLLADRRAILCPISNVQAAKATATFDARSTMSLADYVGHEADLRALADEHRSMHTGYESSASVPFFAVKIPYTVCEEVGELDERFGARGAEDVDYCVRASLAGCALEWALGSYVLHFQGRARPETAERLSDRTKRSHSVFQQKWGAALTYAFIGGDWNLFLTDRKLAPAIAAKQFKPAIERLRARPALEPFIARQQRARFAAVCCIYADDAWLAPTVESVYQSCDSILFLVSDRPWHGEASDQEELVREIRGLSDPLRKIRVVRGSWSDEASQRNEGLRLLAEAGIEYCFVLDADEIYDQERLPPLMNLVRQNPQIDCWRLSCYTYWKSYRYRVDPPEAATPAVFIRVGASHFVEDRHVRGGRHAVVPVESGAIHHMSYARTDAQILRKISTFSHAGQVVPGWYENVWLGWDADRSLPNLNPCWPGAYQRVVEQTYNALPPVLRRLWDRDACASTEPAAV